MPATRLHLVRHGEVHNPDGVLYGRLPGFRLSELGQRMAAAAARSFVDAGVDVRAVVASPLQRTQESAAPWAEAYDLDVRLDERLIEPTNRYEGQPPGFTRRSVARPTEWPWIANPLRPSWGEAYASIANRMTAALETAWGSIDGGDVVLVSHQLPIWTVHRRLAGEHLWHDPRARRCALSSITSVERRGGRFVEVGYADPAGPLRAGAVDMGAV
ncbi:histidine phosphatase family protein [Curtobacterium sp. MCBD17_013]|uniref:histidine phosphatase family protein n=1 Tax=unclassified Curtobacterium TaxID=257496 RepID=UPI000DA889EC|nr:MULTISPECIES: histidine phosphatase family protein [unclassified Curtobacterium]PZF64318.1 histidine phosphatase family protein [Curtobacterium sp. MCBD17_013]WIB62706.1 histidine phosphatase family protein [Curtobacterium sp. MCBD17_040]